MHSGRVPQAFPRNPEEIARLTEHPDILDAAKRRGVQNVVHFTTMTGALGVLAAKALKSRCRLPADKYLEHVYRPNSEIRKDEQWFNYANLSVERINDWMFEASKRWHADFDNPWVVLSFDPTILTHRGVVFTTTNNIYPSCRRAEGVEGFAQMFAAPVRGRYGRLHDRSGKMPSWPTDRQAEVLYPVQLSCDYLRHIDVQTEEATDAIHGMLGGLGVDVSVLFAPEVFK